MLKIAVKTSNTRLQVLSNVPKLVPKASLQFDWHEKAFENEPKRAIKRPPHPAAVASKKQNFFAPTPLSQI